MEMSDFEAIKPLAKPPGYREPGAPPPPDPLKRPKPLPSFHPDKKQHRHCRNCFCRFCCCFIIFVVLLTLFFISFGGFFYLYYEPRVPEVSLKSFQVEKFEVVSAKNGLQLDSRIDIGLELKNNNKKMKFVYDKISMFLTGSGLRTGELDLGQETVPGFIQGFNNVTVMKFSIKGNHQKQGLNDQDAKKLRDQIRAKSLMMKVEIRTGIGAELDGVSTGNVGVEVVCGEFSLKEIQSGGKPSCKVFVFRMPVYVY